MVSYFTQDTDFKFKSKRLTSQWLKLVAQAESKKLGAVSVIFCSDNYLLGVNKKYLNHDYFTDIITFDYCEGDLISGDLFISIDSVKDNSEFYKSCFEDELNRVIVHGVLHLIGYDDHTESDVAVMRSKEDFYLNFRSTLL
jgi:rRNA maturation RNase YbeY